MIFRACCCQVVVPNAWCCTPDLPAGQAAGSCARIETTPLNCEDIGGTPVLNGITSYCVGACTCTYATAWGFAYFSSSIATDVCYCATVPFGSSVTGGTGFMTSGGGAAAAPKLLTTANNTFVPDVNAVSQNYLIHRYGQMRTQYQYRNVWAQPLGGVSYTDPQHPLVTQDEVCSGGGVNQIEGSSPAASAMKGLPCYKERIHGTYTWTHPIAGTFSIPFIGYKTQDASGAQFTMSYQLYIDYDDIPEAPIPSTPNYTQYNQQTHVYTYTPWSGIAHNSLKWMMQLQPEFTDTVVYVPNDIANLVDAGDTVMGNGGVTDDEAVALGRRRNTYCTITEYVDGTGYVTRPCVAGDAGYNAPPRDITSSDGFEWVLNGTPTTDAKRSGFRIVKRAGSNLQCIGNIYWKNYPPTTGLDTSLRFGWRAYISVPQRYGYLQSTPFRHFYINSNGYTIEQGTYADIVRVYERYINGAYVPIESQFGDLGSSQLAQESDYFRNIIQFLPSNGLPATFYSDPLGQYPYPHETNGYSNVSISASLPHQNYGATFTHTYEIEITASDDDIEPVNVTLTNTPASKHCRQLTADGVPATSQQVVSEIAFTLNDTQSYKRNLKVTGENGIALGGTRAAPTIKAPTAAACQDEPYYDTAIAEALYNVRNNCTSSFAIFQNGYPYQYHNAPKKSTYYDNFYYSAPIASFPVGNGNYGSNDADTLPALWNGFFLISGQAKTFNLRAANALGMVSGGIRYYKATGGWETKIVATVTGGTKSDPLSRFVIVMNVPATTLNHGWYHFWLENEYLTTYGNESSAGSISPTGLQYGHILPAYVPPSGSNTKTGMWAKGGGNAFGSDIYPLTTPPKMFNKVPKFLFMESTVAPLPYGDFGSSTGTNYRGKLYPPNLDEIKIDGTAVALTAGNGLNQMVPLNNWKTPNTGSPDTTNSLYTREPTLSTMIAAHTGFTGTKTVEFKTRGGSYVAEPITFYKTPCITSASPPRGAIAGGYSVTFTGTDLSNVTRLWEALSGSRTYIGRTFQGDFTITSQSDTQIVVTMKPAAYTFANLQTAEQNDYFLLLQGLSDGMLFDKARSAEHGTDQFMFVNAVNITSISPSSGATAGGTVVTATGTNIKWMTSIEVDGTAVAFTTTTTGTNAYKRAEFTTPAAGSGGAVNIVFKNDGGQSTRSFTYV